MPVKVLIVPDKFKGSLTAEAAAQAIAAGWRQARPADTLELLPMSDGGDGFGEIIARVQGALPQRCRGLNAAHRPVQTPWWWEPVTKTAVVESAKVIGLAQLPRGKYHPFELDTHGLGLLLQIVAGHGVKRCLVGIGGSATNDAGFGLARALGWEFFNSQGQKLDRWTQLHALAEIRPPEKSSLFRELRVAVDVGNPLLGPQGCTRIYGPQKGVRPEDIDFAEKCLSRLAAVLKQKLHLDYADDPGAGAAGGLGFGLRSFLNAALEPGFDLFAASARLQDRLAKADLVLTGEGALDASTVMGKGVGNLATLCRQLNRPCIALAGAITSTQPLEGLFTQVHALTPNLATPDQAMAKAAFWLTKLSEQTARSYSI